MRLKFDMMERVKKLEILRQSKQGHVRFVQSVERDADEVLKLLTTFYVQDTLKQTTTTIQESRF